MRTIKVYRHGCTLGTAPLKNDHLREKRSTVSGWSHGATRRNTAFLRSVVEPELSTDSQGQPLRAYAVTLTLKDCPATSDDWHKLRKAFLMRLSRAGLYRSHWVTEWQRRGVPHLHGAFWVPMDVMPWQIIRHWLELTSSSGASDRGQFITPITDAVGWFKYLAKHASRGVSHYQRNPMNIPPEWRKKTGRVWGKTGDWPVRDAIAVELDDQAYFALRRLLKHWRHADARASVPESVSLAVRKQPELSACPPHVQLRASGALRRVVQARRMLTCGCPRLSAVRGASEWLPEEVQLIALDWLRSEGYSVTC